MSFYDVSVGVSNNISNNGVIEIVSAFTASVCKRLGRNFKFGKFNCTQCVVHDPTGSCQFSFGRCKTEIAEFNRYLVFTFAKVVNTVCVSNRGVIIFNEVCEKNSTFIKGERYSCCTCTGIFEYYIQILVSG